MRPSAPAVAARPSRSRTTALTASAWNRSTCSAALRVNDQRIAVESKLPEIALCPSDEIASAISGSFDSRSEEHTSELQSPCNLVCRLLLEKKKLEHTASAYA